MLRILDPGLSKERQLFVLIGYVKADRFGVAHIDGARAIQRDRRVGRRSQRYQRQAARGYCYRMFVHVMRLLSMCCGLRFGARQQQPVQRFGGAWDGDAALTAAFPGDVQPLFRLDAGQIHRAAVIHHRDLPSGCTQHRGAERRFATVRQFDGG